ncbi:hypothetical protein [Chryseobacterium shigense]|uniref:SH3 domain-containing protein n=1 Tax=Chryseobacterium shigense TaxID=297244 RepID=A0A841MX18_9FLAO|nr:hypothetical protein [Chryseobacterium shigense]MBB6369084.1 hypothetical protein [Chryseobacterium shigense]
MKRILNPVFLLIMCITLISCSTNYYTVLLSEDLKMYKSQDSTDVITVIPKDTPIYLSSKSSKKNYKKIKWNDYSGWAFNPSYTSYSNYTPIKTSSSYSTSNYNSSYRSGGSVHVKGYTRKDGTYVKPHTRSSPSRRR